MLVAGPVRRISNRLVTGGSQWQEGGGGTFSLETSMVALSASWHVTKFSPTRTQGGRKAYYTQVGKKEKEMQTGLM